MFFIVLKDLLHVYEARLTSNIYCFH